MSTMPNDGENLTPKQPSEASPQQRRRTRTPLQLYYIHRLKDLISLRNTYWSESPTEAWLVPALDKAIYSTLLDCIEYKVGKDAKSLLKRELHTN